MRLCAASHQPRAAATRPRALIRTPLAPASAKPAPDSRLTGKRKIRHLPPIPQLSPRWRLGGRAWASIALVSGSPGGLGGRRIGDDAAALVGPRGDDGTKGLT